MTKKIEDDTVVAAPAPAPALLSNKMFSDTIWNIFQKEIMNRYSQELLKPITNKIYNFLYPYIWMICIYNVFLFVLILANFLLLLKLTWKNKYYDNI
jgi:hypothetical protein